MDDNMNDYNNRNGDYYNNPRYGANINPYQAKYGNVDNNGGMDRRSSGYNPVPGGSTPIPPTQPYSRPQLNSGFRYGAQQVPPQSVPQYEQPQTQISNQDFEDQFDYSRGPAQSGQIPAQGYNQMPQPMPIAPVQQPQPQKKKGLFSFGRKQPQQIAPVTAQQYLNMQTPQSVQDVKVIIDMLKAGDMVIVDFSRMNEKDCQRMIDYLSGAIYALGGFQQPMGDRRFAFTPPGTGIRGNINI